MIEDIKRIWRWLIQKAPELKHLSHKDAALAYAVALIGQKVSVREVRAVPLYNLKPIHPITRPSTKEKMAERIKTIAGQRQEILEQNGGVVTQDFLKTFLPSATWIKAVEDADGTYITFEGNGRVNSLRRVFKPEDKIKIEVEIYRFADPTPILKQVHETRRLYGLEP